MDLAIKIMVGFFLCFNIVVFIIGSCSLSRSTTSGYPGAWTSSGESWTFGGSGIAYLILSAPAQICAWLTSEAAVVAPTKATVTTDKSSNGTVTSINLPGSYFENSEDAKKVEFKKDQVWFVDTQGLMKGCAIRIFYSDIISVKREDHKGEDGCNIAFLTIKTKSKTWFRGSEGGDWNLLDSNDYTIMTNKIDDSNVKATFEKLEKALNDHLEQYKNSEDYKKELKGKEELDNTEFMKGFKKKYKVSFNDYMSSFRIMQFAKDSLPKSNQIMARLQTYAFGFSIVHRQYFAFKLYRDTQGTAQIIKDTLLPEQKLLFGEGFCGKDFAQIVKYANFEAFDKQLYPLEDIIAVKEIDVTYHDNIPSFNYKKRPSALSLAFQSEFIHPMYAVGSVLEYQESLNNQGRVEVKEETYFETLFKTHPLHKLYLEKKSFVHLEEFAKYVHELEVEEVEEKKPAKTPKNKEIVPEKAPEKEEKPVEKKEKSKAEKLKELKELLDDGVITQEDYDKAKHDILTQ